MGGPSRPGLGPGGANDRDAKGMGNAAFHDDAARLLDETLKEEIKTDEILTRLGEETANRQAA